MNVLKAFTSVIRTVITALAPITAAVTQDTGFILMDLVAMVSKCYVLT